MNYLKNKALLLFIMIGLGLTLHAGTGTPPPPPAPPGENLPIPGIFIAMVAAVGYGVYKHLNNPKK